MALECITNINVDFYNKKYILINAKQLDKQSRFISVTCYNNGDHYPLNKNQQSAYVRYKKPDNHSVFNVCTINTDGTISVELTEQMLATDGICYIDLVIVDAGNAKIDKDTGEITNITNAPILSTMVFCIDVSETAVNNSEVESSYEFNALNELLQKVHADYTEVIQLAKSYAIGDAGGIRVDENIDNAKYYYEQALITANDSESSAVSAAEHSTKAETYASNALSYSNNAQTYMNNAKTYMENAKTSETNSATSATNAKTSATNAGVSENTAKGYATEAQDSMNSAIDSATSASTSATNAYNYYLQTEAITNGLNGAFSPKGTITFAELIALKESGAVAAGYLYHISDDFTTDDNFRVSGKVCGAGTSVYYTVDDKFDCFVGTTVAGVKGENEAEYRTGMVNITPENIGAISTSDIATVDEIKNYLGIV